MALAAGRVGVSPQDVDNRGHVTAGGMTPEQAAKLDRALVSPITAPLENEIVGVGTGNDQIMIKTGTGVQLSGTTSPYTFTLDPEPTASDAGKVLKVKDDGSLEWGTAGGSGGVTELFTYTGATPLSISSASLSADAANYKFLAVVLYQGSNYQIAYALARHEARSTLLYVKSAVTVEIDMYALYATVAADGMSVTFGKLIKVGWTDGHGVEGSYPAVYKIFGIN